MLLDFKMFPINMIYNYVVVMGRGKGPGVIKPAQISEERSFNLAKGQIYKINVMMSEIYLAEANIK